MHVTLRVRSDVPPLRTGRFIRAFRTTLSMCTHRTGFRVVHYSVQTNHVHLLVEANDAHKLGCGMKSLGARFARAVNRVFRRSGPVLKERYHMRALRTPREVRNALAYVLLNARKHYRERHGRLPRVQFDSLSSAQWFDGWKRGWDPGPPGRVREVSPARSWVLRTGWRKHRLISPEEVPGKSAGGERTTCSAGTAV